MPLCIDLSEGSSLVAAYSCNRSFNFVVGARNNTLNGSEPGNKRDLQDGSGLNATGNSVSGDNRACNSPRVLHQRNYLVGPVMITQRRLGKLVTCDKVLDDQFRAKFQGVCRGTSLDAQPYGVDPAFVPASSIYDGTLDPQNYYSEEEFAPSRAGMPPKPYGFFPVRC